MESDERKRLILFNDTIEAQALSTGWQTEDIKKASDVLARREICIRQHKQYKQLFETKGLEIAEPFRSLFLPAIEFAGPPPPANTPRGQENKEKELRDAVVEALRPEPKGRTKAQPPRLIARPPGNIKAALSEASTKTFRNEANIKTARQGRSTRQDTSQRKRTASRSNVRGVKTRVAKKIRGIKSAANADTTDEYKGASKAGPREEDTGEWVYESDDSWHGE
ncbi:uncharacterized protein BDZ99DRAFT_200085 [Mytilinidion resinicola]|uniref:Uncharacterized protein n=1 Tax=Mytilinidion resinicola TaxID=574789 RepID=A0A6A6Y1W6_9PEZI|nr:uncharacterized protein BDZ99DRAFT_200085 [Mytilinidion resinicola]KAF2802806.1 hypothetical protein BDZ99DRAFT_200085 [Mytilinidion resinicola]